MTSIYDTPITNGSDAWLRLMREMEAEAYDDSPAPEGALPVAPLAALEILAALARTCVATSHEGAAAEAGYVQDRDDEAVLITWPAPL